MMHVRPAGVCLPRLPSLLLSVLCGAPLAAAPIDAAMLPQEPAPAPGISQELAILRKQVISEVQYDLRFRIERGATEVAGEIWLRFRLPEEQELNNPIVLDFAGKTISDVLLNDTEVTLTQVHNHLLLPADKLGYGWNGLVAKFTAEVAPTGTPLTVYRDAQSGQEFFYTLVVPADAHRLYPCFDQPDLRANFRIELLLPSDWVAVSNAAQDVEATETTGNSRTWRFAPTKSLPTYLMAFACGPFRTTTSPLTGIPGIERNQPLRIFYRASEEEHLDRDALVTLHTEGLRWLTSYFGVPYPFDKLDIVLLPGFPYGGMEHAGAIFYRESALAFDHPPTAAELARRSTLVYHELSHQWFGNLVTMKWFEDLWLKEGFATFVGYQALEALEPERRAWLRFLQRIKPRAYEVDATPGTTPVFQALSNLADAKSAYGAIVYNKAPAVLRELNERLGSDAFRDGLQRFLKKHAFGNADWQDLAAALEGASRQNLTRWSDRWLLAPSMPQVRVDWTIDDNGLVRRATLRQRAIGGDGTWPLDLEVLVIDLAGGKRVVRVRSDAAETSIADLVGGAAPAAVIVNPRDVAYGQFVPDQRSNAWLLEHLPDEADPLLRAAATGALFEAVREAELDPAAFADLCLRLLAHETDPDTHGWLLDALGTSALRYLPTARRGALLQRATQMLLDLLATGETSGRELTAFRFLARASTDPRVLSLCRAVALGEAVPAGLQPGRLDRFLAAAALLAANADGADAVLAKLQADYANEDVGKESYLCRAAIPTAENKQEYWQSYLQLDTPPEQWTQDSLAFFHWPMQDELTLPYLQRALERVDWVKANRRIFFMPAWLDAFVNGHSSAQALQIVDDFLARSSLSDDVRNKLLQSRDGLVRTVRIRAVFGEDPTGDGKSREGK